MMAAVGTKAAHLANNLVEPRVWARGEGGEGAVGGMEERGEGGW